MTVLRPATAGHNAPRYAARLNAFKIGLPGKPTAEDMLRRAASVEGLNAADLNYPDHFDHHSASEMGTLMGDLGIALNGAGDALLYPSWLSVGRLHQPGQGPCGRRPSTSPGAASTR